MDIEERTVERISEKAENALVEHLMRGKDSTDPKEKELHERRISNARKILRTTTSLRGNSDEASRKIYQIANTSRRIRLVDYTTLTRLMRIDGELTGEELMNLMGVDTAYPEEAYNDIIEGCKEFTNEELVELKKIAYELSCDWWKQTENNPQRPSSRIRKLDSRMLSSRATIGMPEEILQKFNDNHWASTFPTEWIPEICRYYKVSPHWIMNLQNVPYYAVGKIEIDDILDSFSFMGKNEKAVFLKLVKSIGGSDR